jgi:hypothetical protein
LHVWMVGEPLVQTFLQGFHLFALPGWLEVKDRFCCSALSPLEVNHSYSFNV